MEDYLGTIKAFAGNYAPVNWALCNGQLLSVTQNSALFAILGTTYGGNGIQTFGLPDLRGRAAVGWGQGPGLSNYVLGEVSGTEKISILQTNMPAHNHAAVSNLTFNVSNEPATLNIPVAGNALSAAKDVNGDNANIYNTSAPNTAIVGGTVATTIGVTGGSLPISILQPTLALTYIICTSGLYPSRN